jgi:hypothetical protein
MRLNHLLTRFALSRISSPLPHVCKSFCFAGILLYALQGNAQNGIGYTDFNKLLPVTPEAASLQKAVKIPIEYSTGVPNISIPLFELSTGNISIPISLNYHASGIRVDQLASSTGLGWGLSAGGAIQRSIRTVADEGTGWFSHNFTQHFADSLNSDGSIEANNYRLSGEDFSQDDYSYNFLGFAGSFFYDSTKALRQVF